MKYTDEYIKSDAFLDTFEWRKLRMEVIVKHGNRCQCCGSSPQSWNNVMIHVDHINARRTHPDQAFNFDNLQILCNSCNHGKSNWDNTDWRVDYNNPIDLWDAVTKRKDVKLVLEMARCQIQCSGAVSDREDQAEKVERPSNVLLTGIPILPGVRNLLRTTKYKNNVALSVIVMNLLANQKKGVIYSRDSSKGRQLSSSRKLSTRVMMRAIDFLESAGFLINVRGRGHKNARFRIPSTIYTTARFIERFSNVESIEWAEKAYSDTLVKYIAK